MIAIDSQSVCSGVHAQPPVCQQALSGALREIIDRPSVVGSTGILDQALQLLRELTDLARSALITDGDTDTMHRSLRVDQVIRLDRPDLALIAHTELVHESRQQLGAEHLRTLVLKIALALAMNDAGKEAAAKRLMDALASVLAKKCGLTHPLAVAVTSVSHALGCQDTVSSFPVPEECARRARTALETLV